MQNTYAAVSLNDIFTQGNDFFDPNSKTPDSFANGIAGLVDNVYDIISIIGNIIILICGAILGVKYVWSTASEKADAKGGLGIFALGVIFFYCATGLYGFVSGSIGEAFNATSIEAIGGNIYKTILVIIDVCCVVALSIIGLKYMFSTPDVRGDLKKKFIPMIMGIILIYSTSQIINIIVGFVGESGITVP